MDSHSRSNRPAALVTGSAVRLGRAIAIDLARRGYDIALHFRSSDDAAAQTASAIRALGVASVPFQADLADVTQITGLIEEVAERFPQLSLLVNSASAYQQATIAATTPDLFDQQLNVNLRAPFFLTQTFASHVASGHVINIIDNKVGFNQYEYAAYLLAKKALVEFTRMAALEFAPRLRVNGVAPGVVLPAKRRSPEYVAWRIEGIPLKMQGDVTHITKAVATLIDNAFMTGQILVVDGGESLTNVGQNAAQFDQDKV